MLQKRIGFLLTAAAWLMLGMYGCNINTGKQLNVMVVAGGHSFDTTEFVEMFSAMEKITFDTVMQPRANRMIAAGETDQYDVILFYDMWNEADSATRAGYQRLLEKGIGMVFLHHALAGYQQWIEYANIIGGKYHSPKSYVDSSMYSGYKHDIEMDVSVVRSDHPVTRGMQDFSISDEGYSNIEVKGDVMVILTTDHPDASEKIGWVTTYRNSKLVYLMPGHGKQAYTNPNYRELVANSIDFVYRQGQF
jgi:type 1 glutamine amidotransferase